MAQQPKRNRPRLSVSISKATLDTLRQAEKDLALPNPGVLLDFIVNDWANLKRIAIHAAAPTEPTETYVTHPDAEVR